MSVLQKPPVAQDTCVSEQEVLECWIVCHIDAKARPDTLGLCQKLTLDTCHMQLLGNVWALQLGLVLFHASGSDRSERWLQRTVFFLVFLTNSADFKWLVFVSFVDICCDRKLLRTEPISRGHYAASFFTFSQSHELSVWCYERHGFAQLNSLVGSSFPSEFKRLRNSIKTRKPEFHGPLHVDIDFIPQESICNQQKLSWNTFWIIFQPRNAGIYLESYICVTIPLERSKWPSCFKDPYLRTAERAAARVTSENHIGDGWQQSPTPRNGHSLAILTVGVLKSFDNS